MGDSFTAMRKAAATSAVGEISKIADFVSYDDKIIHNTFNEEKNTFKMEHIIDTINNYIQGEIRLRDPLTVAENLHKGNYVENASDYQLWALKRFYEKTNYVVGLVDVGRKFLSKKRYHGAFEAFHVAEYSQGLLDVVKDVVDEVHSGNRKNIVYAKKALDDIVKIEGKKGVGDDVRTYINTIAEAYIKQYEIDLDSKEYRADKNYLTSALHLYKLNRQLTHGLKNEKVKSQFNIWRTLVKRFMHDDSNGYYFPSETA